LLPLRHVHALSHTNFAETPRLCLSHVREALSIFQKSDLEGPGPALGRRRGNTGTESGTGQPDFASARKDPCEGASP
jgi:hypothetical protein